MHVWDFASSDESTTHRNEKTEAQVKRYNKCLRTMGVDFQLSGHAHDLRFFKKGTDGVKVPILRCGGISEGYVGHSLTYTVLEYHQGNITMTGYNTRKKEAVFNKAYQMH